MFFRAARLTSGCAQVLVAYVSQGASIGTRIFPVLPTAVTGGIFLGTLSFALYILNDEQVDTMYAPSVSTNERKLCYSIESTGTDCGFVALMV